MAFSIKCLLNATLNEKTNLLFLDEIRACDTDLQLFYGIGMYTYEKQVLKKQNTEGETL